MSTDPHKRPQDSDPSDRIEGHAGGLPGESESEESGQEMLRDYGRYGSVGLQFGVSLVLFSLGGYWLDRKFGIRIHWSVYSV
ncbi:MAG TPA: AtpZ/AtpI family protein, partial [Planctomycetota bacterium]|nr:AtpZ/AtpI family protein [Planctomycetota bacterium]